MNTIYNLYIGEVIFYQVLRSVNERSPASKGSPPVLKSESHEVHVNTYSPDTLLLKKIFSVARTSRDLRDNANDLF